MTHSITSLLVSWFLLSLPGATQSKPVYFDRYDEHTTNESTSSSDRASAPDHVDEQEPLPTSSSQPTDDTVCCPAKEELLDLRAQVLDYRDLFLARLLATLTLLVAVIGIGFPILLFFLGRSSFKRWREEAEQAAGSAKEAEEAAQSAARTAKENREALEALKEDANRRFQRIRDIANMDI